MLYLLLAPICSAIISLLLRIGNDHVPNTAAITTAGYTASMLFALLSLGGSAGFSAAVSSQALPLGLAAGAAYLLDMVLYQWCIRRHGTILPGTFNKMGIILPILVAALLFREIPSPVQFAGLLLALLAIPLISLRRTGAQMHFSASLLLLLILNGMMSLMNNLFLWYGDASRQGLFTFFLFAGAAASSLIPLALQRRPVTRSACLIGLGVGLFNFLGTRCTLLALSAGCPSYLVYPVVSAGTVLLVCLLGRLIYRERLQPCQLGGVACTLCALTLLNL